MPGENINISKGIKEVIGEIDQVNVPASRVGQAYQRGVRLSTLSRCS